LRWAGTPLLIAGTRDLALWRRVKPTTMALARGPTLDKWSEDPMDGMLCATKTLREHLARGLPAFAATLAGEKIFCLAKPRGPMAPPVEHTLIGDVISPGFTIERDEDGLIMKIGVGHGD